MRLVNTFGSTQGRQISVPLHTVPNVAIGSVARRHITRIAFPRMYATQPDKAVPSSALKYLFNDGIRKVVSELMPHRLTHWPANYDTALRQTQDHRGQIHHMSIDIAANNLPAFGQRLLERLSHQPDMQDAYFIHELRGTKGGTDHDPSDDFERSEAFEELMSHLDPELCQLDDWQIDVALEISMPDHVTHIAHSSHFRILKWLLPSAANAQLNRLMQSDRFYVDQCASLDDLAGFRCELGNIGRDDQISYINVYCTEKSVIYQLHNGGIFRRRTPTELFPNSLGKLIKDVDDIGKAFHAASGSLDADGVPGNARFEIRVPLRTALDRLRQFPELLAELSLIGIPINVWWYVCILLSPCNYLIFV
jgi:hypothetical protein